MVGSCLVRKVLALIEKKYLGREQRCLYYCMDGEVVNYIHFSRSIFSFLFNNSLLERGSEPEM